MIVIAGAGIGGLTPAATLKRAGKAFRIVERAAELRPVGAGITVQANAILALRRLGLDEAVARAGAVARTARICDARGRVLSEAPLDDVARELDASFVALHRARLQEVLLGAVGASVVETGAAVSGYRDDGERVVVELGAGRTIDAELLVACDGLRSRVRAQAVGDDVRYAGYTSWRGVCPRDDLATEGLTTESWGRGARFGIVPIGHGETYWFATANAPPHGEDPKGGARAGLLERFGDWHAPIRALLEATPEDAVVRTDIADRAPIASWTFGRVALLGDAAHPMTPNLGQGGGQAIEDAVVLGEALAEARDVSAALARYEARRVARANGFVATSWTLGRVGQWESAIACAARDLLVRATPARTTTKQLRERLRFE